MENIQTKYPLSIEIAEAFMQGIMNNCKNLFTDKEFVKRFDSLLDLIHEKSELPLATTIVDIYVVCEQLPPSDGV